jgi:hypothetical protein
MVGSRQTPQASTGPPEKAMTEPALTRGSTIAITLLMYVCMYVCMYSELICMYVCTYIYMYVCMYVCRLDLLKFSKIASYLCASSPPRSTQDQRSWATWNPCAPSSPGRQAWTQQTLWHHQASSGVMQGMGFT